MTLIINDKDVMTLSVAHDTHNLILIIAPILMLVSIRNGLLPRQSLTV